MLYGSMHDITVW